MFAGRRVVSACDFEADSQEQVFDVGVWTATPSRPKAESVGEFYTDVEADFEDAGEIVNAAGDGHSIVFFGAGWQSFMCDNDPDCACVPGCTWGQGVWRMVGSQPVRVPKKFGVLADVAVAGRWLATLEWKSPSSCCDASPAWSPDGREITWNNNGAVWLVGADGTSPRRLSAPRAEAVVGDPRWSPDGKSVAYQVGCLPSPERCPFFTYVVGRGGDDDGWLAEGAAAWSPNGTRLAYECGYFVSVCLASGSGGNGKWFANNASSPAWSPDGNSLAVARVGSVYILDPTNGAVRMRTFVGSPGEAPYALAWSLDGSMIVVSSSDGVWLVPTSGTGSGPRALPLHGRAAWSPDGRWLAGSSGREVEIVKPDGTSARQFATGSDAECAGAAWSRDGETIATSCGGALRLIDVTPGTSRLLAAPLNAPLVELRQLTSGKPIRSWPVQIRDTRDSTIALAGRYLVVRERPATLHVFDVNTGMALGRWPLEDSTGNIISFAGYRAVYTVGRSIRLIDIRNGRRSTLAASKRLPVGPVIIGRRVFWADGKHVRELVVR